MLDLIERISVRGNRIEIRPPASLRRFVRRDVFFEYPGHDLATLPREIAVLPYLWAMAAIVWASGEDYTVDSLSDAVVSSLDEVRSVVREIYPQSQWRGGVSARATVSLPARPAGHFRRGVMFTAGVDSTYTALRNAGPETLLVSVWGADVELSEHHRWERWMADAARFAGLYAGGVATVRTNLREALNYYPRLNTLVPGLQRWWLDVQFSMALTGSAAPIAYLEGIENLYFASGLDIGDEVNYPHASFPRLDNRIVLGNARVRHHGNDTKRQQKLAWIVANGPEMELRVCHTRRPEAQLNCGSCTKCLRTMIGLVICSADPTRYGFPMYRPTLLDELPPRFAAYEFHFRTHETQLWLDMQEAIDPDEAAQDDFLGWLKQMDFDRYQRSQPRRAARSRAVARSVAARAPALRGALRRAVGARTKRRLP